MAEYADMKIAQGGATQRPALRDTYNQACWFLLNGGSRACIKERGHDEGVHEGPSPVDCDNNAPHERHGYTVKYQCNGAAGA